MTLAGSAGVTFDVLIHPSGEDVDAGAEVGGLRIDASAELRALCVDPATQIRSYGVDPRVEPAAQGVDPAAEIHEAADHRGGEEADRGPGDGFHARTVALGYDVVGGSGPSGRSRPLYP